jgi:endonuclease YncB( thermonuclease family)
LLVLLAAGLAAALNDEWIDPPRKISAGAQQIRIADGDSFSIGTQKLRLDGIDAPEYLQTCDDPSGSPWECGKSSRATLEQLLRQPGLACVTDATDKYGRSIAKCSTAAIADIGAVQVMTGMAVSHEYFGIRDYGDEEDMAQNGNRGIWAGTFTPPVEWRETHVQSPI